MSRSSAKSRKADKVIEREVGESVQSAKVNGEKEIGGSSTITVTNSVLTTSVEHGIPLGMLSMIVQLNIFPPHSCLLSLDTSNSILSRGLVIEPGAQLYEEGNVTILVPYHSLFLIVHSFQLTTWRGNQ